MSEKRGYKWDLKVASAAAPTIFKTVGQASDVEITEDGEVIDVSVRAGAGWKNKEQGLKEWKCSVQHLWLPSDDAYLLIKAAWENGTKLLCQFSETTPATGVPGFDGNAIVKSKGTPQKLNGAVFMPIEFEGDGPLTAVTRA